MVFFGGTALARTHLTDGRLSEDVDLIAIDRRHPVAERLTGSVPRRRPDPDGLGTPPDEDAGDETWVDKHA